MTPQLLLLLALAAAPAPPLIASEDLNNDAVADLWNIDRWGDGTPDIQVLDLNYNQVPETLLFDMNNDGVWYEWIAYDTNENGTVDVSGWDFSPDDTAAIELEGVFFDFNENGVSDNEEEAPLLVGTIGGGHTWTPQDPNWYASTMAALVGMTGGATMGTGDRDGDHRLDNLDYYPDDYYRQ